MLKQLSLQRIKVRESTYIEVDGGVTIFVDDHKNVFIDGHDKIYINTQDDLNLNAKNVNITAKEDVYIGSGKNITQQAPRIDLNPNQYKGKN